MDRDRLAECVGYFKKRKIYARLFGKVREKYVSLGRLGGSFRLEGLDAEDLQQLGGFFQKDFTGKKSVTISFSAMEKALAGSRFEGLGWEEILREYFGEELIARRDREHTERERQRQYFEDILSEHLENPGSGWIGSVLQKRGDGYRLLVKQQREAPEQLKKILRQFLRAVPELPFLKEAQGSKELLAVFAARTTGNPHFFDDGTSGGQFLTAFLKDALSDSLKSGGFQAEAKAELYYRAGLLKDDLSNHTLVYGIHGETKDGSLHEGIEGFLVRREPADLTLMTIGGLKKVRAQRPGIVYMVENPAVFSALIHTWPEETVLCGNGQIRLSMLALLDLFDEDTKFFYAGDFDPEGLLIAQRLRDRYGDRLQFWNYREDLYERYRSNVEISDRRLKKLDKVHAEELHQIRDAIRTEKRAAYQEAMLKEYFENKIDKNHVGDL